MTRAMYSVMSYRLWIWFALGEPPDCGLKNASTEVVRWPKAAGILFRVGADARDRRPAASGRGRA
jgi:hypothetical protein